jgi:hypothetical protein
MSLSYSGSKTVFIDLVYVRRDPTNVDKQIFTYPIGTDFSTFTAMYAYYNNHTITLKPSDYVLLPNSNKIKLELKPFNMNTNYVLKVLCLNSIQRGIDFVDKANQTGTVYSYDKIDIQNKSSYTKMYNTYILSENLLVAFWNTYPMQYTSIKYTNGQATPSISYSPGGIGSDKFIAFYNGEYKGNIGYNGGNIGTFTSPKTGLVEVVCLGVLEFSLNKNGPWLQMLNIPVIGYNETVTCYIRCGQVVTVLSKALNSIKIITTEAV